MLIRFGGAFETFYGLTMIQSGPGIHGRLNVVESVPDKSSQTLLLPLIGARSIARLRSL